MAPNINKLAPIQNVASKINKMAPIKNVAPKINRMAPIQCLPQYSPIQSSAAQYSSVQPNITQYSPVHSSSRALKWPNLVSKWPGKVPRWPIYHYYGCDCTEMHLLSIPIGCCQPIVQDRQCNLGASLSLFPGNIIDDWGKFYP